MKKIVKTIISAVILSQTALLAAETGGLAAMSDMQKFYYDLGRNEAKKEYYSEGYRQAMSDFSVILKKYSTRIQAFEAGKFLVKESKITYPKVYRVKEPSGAYKIQIDAPVVEKAFTEHDLFMLPLADSMQIASQTIDETSISSSSDGFSVPDRDDVTLARDSAPEVSRAKAVVHLPYRNEGIKSAIDSFNLQYAVTKDGYDIFFSTMEEKIDFCMKATGNQQCKL